jgi:hypothetical protein
MPITEDFAVFADNYHKQNRTHNPLIVPYIKVKETNDKLIYYDKKNDKFVWEFKLNLAHLPQDIEEDIGKIITQYKFKKNVIGLSPVRNQTDFPGLSSSRRMSKSVSDRNWNRDRSHYYICGYPQKNGKLCGCSANGERRPPKFYWGGCWGAFSSSLSYNHPFKAEYDEYYRMKISLCRKHEKVKDFSWDTYFKAHGYKLRNGVLCKMCKK